MPLMMVSVQRKLRCLAVGALSLLVSPALADVLDLAGNYGDVKGCGFLKTNDYGDDIMLALTNGGYETYVHGCEFLQALTAGNGDKIVTGVCGEEGEGTTTIEFLRIAKVQDADAYELYSEAGDLIGRVDRCP